jgi:hypothetical protein
MYTPYYSDQDLPFFTIFYKKQGVGKIPRPVLDILFLKRKPSAVILGKLCLKIPEEGPEPALEASAGSPLNTEDRHDLDIRGPEKAGLLNPYEVVGKPHFLGNPQGDALSGKHYVTIIHGRSATLDESRVARGSPPSQAPYDHVPLVAHSF